MDGATTRRRSVMNKSSTKKSRDKEDSDSDFEFDLVRACQVAVCKACQPLVNVSSPRSSQWDNRINMVID